MHHLAYVFERFPSFTQTFCVREVLELERQGLRPLIFSVRDTRDEVPRHFPDELFERVDFLPPEKELVEIIKAEKDANRLPQETVLSLRHWGDRPDKARVYEAAYIGQKMRAAGVRHAHAHFAGIGARVGWWLRHCYDFSFSFTGHANDIFCEEPGLNVDLDRLVSAASLVITVSDFSAAELQRRFPAAASKIQRVYNGIDIEAHTVPRRDGDPPLILSVGRLIPKKGFDDLVSACAELHRRGHRFRCEIIGEGPLEEDLRSQIDSLGLESIVTLSGPLPQSRVLERLSETRIFALACATEPDGSRDNLPTVLMEAMAAAVPCVSTRLAGIPEMVDDGVTGILVEERRPLAFADALDRLLGDPDLCRRMGAAGLERARREFAKEVTAGRLIRLLVARGLTRIDPALVARHPTLAVGSARQLAWRAARLARFRSLRHRRAPDFLEGPAPQAG